MVTDKTFGAFKYILYTPDSGGHLPLIVVLHGSGEIGSDLGKLKKREPYLSLKSGKCIPNVVVLMPQLPKGTWGECKAALKDLIDHVAGEHGCDVKRVSITGHSLGANGTLDMLLAYPDYFSAASVLSPCNDIGSKLEQIAHVPMWFLAGEKEHNYKKYAQSMYDRLTKPGGETKLTLVPGVGHPIQFTWVSDKYGMFDWLAGYSHFAYVWIPGYRKKNKPPMSCDMWQYTPKGRLPGISKNVDLDVLTGTKPMSFFTTGTENTDTTDTDTNGGETEMANDYRKYILSTGTHYISNSGGDENGNIKGGKAGDQSKKEWYLRPWYSRPWTCVLRFPDIVVGTLLAQLGIDAALNDKIGYDQGQRYTYQEQLKKVGWLPSKIVTACEEDCTAGVNANVHAAAYLLDIPALKKIPETSVRSSNMRKLYTAAGFQVLTDPKYLISGDYLLPGDILLYDSHHGATNVTCGKKIRSGYTYQDIIDHLDEYRGKTEPVAEGLRRGDKGDAVKAMQRLLLKWDYACLPKFGADGDFGSETEQAVKDFQAMSKLPVTGIYDAATDAALKAANFSHVKITGGSVNVRSAPGTSFRILGTVHKGDILLYQGMTEEADGRPWYLVVYDNANGWVSSKYAQLIE